MASPAARTTPMIDRPGAPRARHGRAGPLDVVGIVLLTAATRLAYLPDGVVGKDAPLYFNSLNFDRTFNVPPPGNIGYVALGKAANQVWTDPALAFAAVAVLISCLGAAYLLLLASLLMGRGAAFLLTAAAMLSSLTWYHGTPVMSYIVWFAFPPAIAYYGLGYLRERRPWMLIAASVATGLSTILRPDMVAFAGPLLGGFLVLGRAPARLWLASAAICAACCAVWFFGTAAVLGGVGVFLESSRAKHEFHETFGVGAKGALEGLGRNGAKYAVLLIWTAHLAIPLAALGVLRDLRALASTWRGWFLAALWVGPSLYFSIIVFMGNAGLVLPAIPLLYIAAARGLEWVAPAANRRRTVLVGLGALAALNAAQFIFTPIPRPTDQRLVILTVMFFKYSGAGIRTQYNHNLLDFGIDPSLANTVRQLKDPEPVPLIPAEYLAPLPQAPLPQAAR